ncbi:MAG: hypothetical protein WCC90_06215 [Methylocella sp.]|jgi:hypothetical protein
MSNKWLGWLIAGSALLVATAIVVLPAMGKPPPPLPPLDILHDEAFGPTNYMSGRSMMPDGSAKIDFALPQGKSFSYIEGKSITLNDGKKTIIISINGADLQVGTRHCKSSDTACIVHAIRRQEKNFTNHDSAQAFDPLSRELATLALQARIDDILQALATLPRSADDDRDED